MYLGNSVLTNICLQFQKLLDKYIAEIDKNLLQLKKATAAK